MSKWDTTGLTMSRMKLVKVNYASKDSTQCPRNSLHCGTQPMWEDSTYLTSQSDDMDTIHGVILYNTWMTAMQIAINSELNT